MHGDCLMMAVVMVMGVLVLVSTMIGDDGVEDQKKEIQDITGEVNRACERMLPD